MSRSAPAETRLPVNPLAAAADIRPPRTGSVVWHHFRRHRLAMIGLTLLTLLTIGAVFAPIIAGRDPFSIDLSAYRTGPSAGHPLGTDSAGRDVFSRLLFAGRVSMSFVLIAV